MLFICETHEVVLGEEPKSEISKLTSAKFDPLPGFVNKVLLNHSHTQSLISCLWLLSGLKQRGVVVTATVWPTKSKLFTLWLLQKKFAGTCGREDVDSKGFKLPFSVFLPLSPHLILCLPLVHGGFKDNFYNIRRYFQRRVFSDCRVSGTALCLVWQAQPCVGAEHLTCGWSKVRCTGSVQSRLHIEDLVPKRKTCHLYF